MCICVYIYTYLYVRIYIHTYMHTRIHKCTYIHIHVYTYTCICILCLHQATAKAALAWLHNCVGRWCLRCSLVSLPPSFLAEFCTLKLWSECALSRLTSYSLFLLIAQTLCCFVSSSFHMRLRVYVFEDTCT